MEPCRNFTQSLLLSSLSLLTNGTLQEFEESVIAITAPLVASRHIRKRLLILK